MECLCVVRAFVVGVIAGGGAMALIVFKLWGRQ